MQSVHPLRAWRLKHGLTQPAAAKRLGVSEIDISRFENGRRMPTLQKAHKLSEITGIPIKEFAKQSEAAE